MKRKNIIILFLAAFVAVGSAFFNFSAAKAQTSTAKRPNRVISPSPTPFVTTPAAPKPSVSPTISPSPTPDDDIIKIDTEIVNLNVRVIDRNNRPINNLLKSDFKVFEDNVPQTIDTISKAEVPTNYSLVVDNSGSLRQQIAKIIDAGKVLISNNRPDDETSVIRFVSRDKIEILTQPGFTSKKEDLNDALDGMYIEGGSTAIIDAVYLAAEEVTKYEQTTDDRKRRALILVSDGEERDSFYNEKQLFEMLRESDVQIFTIGFVDDLNSEGGFISKSPQSKAKALLERLATETGGKSYFPAGINELAGIAQNISNEMRTQYSISYTPTNDRHDGGFRNIKVQVTDGPDKQKRIAVTRAGRTAVQNGSAPTIRKN